MTHKHEKERALRIEAQEKVTENQRLFEKTMNEREMQEKDVLKSKLRIEHTKLLSEKNKTSTENTKLLKQVKILEDKVQNLENDVDAKNLDIRSQCTVIDTLRRPFYILNSVKI